MNAIISVLEKIMDLCYGICGNYGLAIILFTVLSKVILLPLAVWLHKNGIKVVKMQPELNQIKAKYFGDKDTIAEEEAQLYKREHYHPLASIIPLTVQILILIGLIAVIRKGIGNPQIDMKFLGLDLSVVPSVQKGLYLLAPLIAGLSSFVLCVVQNRINPSGVPNSIAWMMSFLRSDPPGIQRNPDCSKRFAANTAPFSAPAVTVGARKNP